MTSYIALLRAVNVGGTGKLPMAELKEMAAGLGFVAVRTYIASGNLMFHSDLREQEVKARLEERLAAYAEKPVAVLVRTASEMAAVVATNPFPDVAGSRCLVFFLDAPPPESALSMATGVDGERLAVGQREIFVDYAKGMRDSKLKIPAAQAGTGRNMNTVAKLAALAAG